MKTYCQQTVFLSHTASHSFTFNLTWVYIPPSLSMQKCFTRLILNLQNVSYIISLLRSSLCLPISATIRFKTMFLAQTAANELHLMTSTPELLTPWVCFSNQSLGHSIVPQWIKPVVPKHVPPYKYPIIGCVYTWH